MFTTHLRKLISRGALVGAAPLILAACGNGDTATTDDTGASDGNSGDQEQVQLEFWSFWGSGPRRETIEEIVEEFNDSHDTITVEYVYQPWGDIWTKSLAAIAGGNAPDIIVQDINSVRQRADANQATNLQSFIDEEDISDQFYPQL